MAHCLSKKLFFLLLAASLLPTVLQAKSLSYNFPRKANYYLSWELIDNRVRELAKWDVVILDMEVQTQPEIMKKLRQLNPKIILLAYITSEEIVDNAAASASKMRRKLASQLASAWYLKNSSGNLLSFWLGTHLLNITNDAPQVNGLRFNQYLAKFVSEQILGSGLWDGVFYDNAWGEVKWLGADFDINNDGVNDGNIDAKWREGLKVIFSETRRLTNNQYLIVGNGNTREYQNELNGKMIENFIPTAWTSAMNTYAYNFSTVQDPKINIINANTANKGNLTDYRQMRFGLASTLMEDGYYSFDYGDQDHSQTWWYDEYGINLGQPIGRSVSLQGYPNYQPDVWQRSFANGLAIVNSTGGKQMVELGGDYEKIHGTQDKKVNDGSIVSETTVDPYDGQILLRTFATLQDVLFKNGSFVRFFRPDGSRVRNGFFVFESGYKGGDKIAHIDLNNNGQQDLIVASGNKLIAWRDDGQLYMKDYPYGVNYKGELKIAIGDINDDGNLEIITGPSSGFPLPIKVYSRYGEELKSNWLPLGKKYKGGYSLAIRHNKNVPNQILIGTGVGVKPEVYVIDDKFKIIKHWLAFEAGFRGGVNVAVGDVDGNGSSEVIVGAGSGKKPEIKIFNIDGKLLSKFIAYQSFNTPGIEVQAIDADYDGKDEILGFGENGF